MNKLVASPGLLRDPVHLFAFGFGAGLSPYAPGTIGTLIAVPIVIFVAQFGWAVHLIFALLACIGGIFLCGESAKRLDVHDHFLHHRVLIIPIATEGRVHAVVTRQDFFHALVRRFAALVEDYGD
jgi:hypothetical protein